MEGEHQFPWKAYPFGFKAFDILWQAYSGYDLQALALGGMVALQRQTGRNVSIAVPDGDFAVVLRAFDNRATFGGRSWPGLRELLYV